MKTFLCRIGIMLPISLFGLYLLLILVGALTNAVGAGVVFYSSVYCKAGIALFALAVVSSVYTQFRCCCRDREKMASVKGDG